MDNPSFVAQPSLDDIEAVAPALQHFTQTVVQGQLWTNPDLNDRDRSLVTLAAAVARNHLVQLQPALEQALTHGVKPAEISELITHLAFYSGWGNAMAAVLPAKAVFERHGVAAADLPGVACERLPLDEESERQRATAVQGNFGHVAPGVVKNTTDCLFLDLWLRPDLAPRDRSLVTVTALVCAGQVAQVTYHLNRAMDNGLTQPQAAEMLTQLAFHGGWPNVFSAMPVFKDVFASRS